MLPCFDLSTMLILLLVLTWTSFDIVQCGNSGAMQRCRTPEMTKCVCLYDDQSMPTVISCNGINLDEVDIPQTVQNFSYTGSKIQKLSKDFIKQCRGAQLPKLTILDLSRNRIRSINPNIFHCLPQLRILRLNNNDLVIHNNDSDLFGNLKGLKELHLQQAFHYPDRIFLKGSGKLKKQRVPEVKNATNITRLFQKSYMPNLHILHLERNQIWYLGSRAFCSLETGKVSSLSKLYLSHNNLGKPDLDNECLPYLTELYLNNNSMPRFTVSFTDHLNLMANLSLLSISNNPWLCDCHFTNTLKWIIKGKGQYVLNGSSTTLRCGFQNEKGKFIKDLQQVDLICQDPESLERRLRNSYIVLGCVFGIVGILFLIVMYMNRAKIVKICKRVKESCATENAHHGYSLAV